MNPETEFREGLDELAGHYKEVLKLLGEDPEREGLVKTPMRVAKAMQILTRGYTQDAHKVLTDALFEEKYDQMVIVKDIDFFSMCEHHMLPFYGKVHVAYIPNGKICRMGNFRNLGEAQKVLAKVKALGYRQACLVKGQITVQY